MNPPTTHPAPNLKDCLSIACQVCSVTESDVCGPGRVAPIIRARAMYAWLAEMTTDTSLPERGRGVGSSSHSSVRKQQAWCVERMRVDPEYKRLAVQAMCGLVACRTLPSRAMEWLVWETAKAKEVAAQ